MTDLQRLQARLAELARKIRLLGDDDLTPESRAEYESAVTAYGDLDLRIRAMQLLEPAPAESDGGPAAEVREYGRILARAELGDFVAEALGGVVTGAAAELRQAVGISDGAMPLEMLVEDRADAATGPFTSIPNAQREIIPRLFTRSAAAYLGVAMPSVPVGQTEYVIMATGTSADVRSDGVALDAGAATLTRTTVNPVRATAGYLFGVEDTQRVRGLEEALARDMRSALSDKLDSLAINGAAAVANTSPAIAGIISSLSNPTNPSSVATWSDYLDAFDAPVDGLYADTGDMVRMLVNSDTYKQARKLVIGTNSGTLLRDRPEMSAGRFRVSAHMPATASTIATAITYTGGTSRPGLVMPVWSGARLIRDEYSEAPAGRVRLTLLTLVGYAMVDSSVYRRLEYKLA